MTRDEIYDRVKDVLVESLGADDEDVSPDASLTGDLGAESIDFLDIVFQLERSFGIKIQQGELFPENVASDPRYVRDGKVTSEGIAALRERLPHADFSEFERDPDLTKVGDVFTVNVVVNFVERKLAETHAA